MKNFELSSAQIAELRLAHKVAKKSSSPKEAYKINAVILLGTGWSLKEVANALLLDDETVRNYAHLYNQGGLTALLKINYHGGHCKLSQEQLSELEDELDQTIHQTTQSVIQFVEQRYSEHYSISGMTSLLRSLGFVYKKPKLIPRVPDEEIQERFIEEYYEFMRTKPKNVALFFADATHPEHNATAGFGWIRKGCDKNLIRQAKGKRVNLQGAINIETLDTVVIEADKIDSQSTIDLFKSLESLFPLAALIYVVLDNAGYHGSAEVKNYLSNSRIRLVPLPARSPNLNLIERLWKLLKKKVVYNKCYEKYKDFRDACVNFFLNLKTYEGELASLMNDDFEIILR